MRAGNLKWLRWEVILIAISILVGLAFAGFMVLTSAQRKLEPLETLLFQFIILFVSLGGGLVGSYKFGQNVAANRQYVRSALRSVMVLFRSLRSCIKLWNNSRLTIQRANDLAHCNCTL